jgi:hypothetical protein
MSRVVNNRAVSRRGEEGNVLFLILIAVVLFAALSYAVTRSSHSNSGGVDNEKGKILAAQIIQYPAGLRVSIVRMIVGGINPEGLRFDLPSGFSGITDVRPLVFHPQGGGATYVEGVSDTMESGVKGPWYFNDIVAFLPGVLKSICASINHGLGIDGIPQVNSDISADYRVLMDDGYVLPPTEIILGVAGGNGTDNLRGQPAGCFQNAGGEYVYYHLLAER